MKRLVKIGLVVSILMLSVLAGATDLLRPSGYEAVVVNDTVGGVALTVSKYFTAATSKIVSDYAIMSLEGGQIRFTVDGVTAPTTAVGTLMELSQVWAFESYDELKNFKAIKTGTTNGNVKVIYYKRYNQ